MKPVIVLATAAWLSTLLAPARANADPPAPAGPSAAQPASASTGAPDSAGEPAAEWTQAGGAESDGEVIEMVDRAPVVASAPGHTEVAREELTTVAGGRGDAVQVVRSLPGVANATAAGAGPGLLVIRGSAPEDSIYLVDGIPIPVVYHFFGLQSIIPGELVDDIEFRPGGFGAEEGRATGGIVEIHTRPSRADHITGFAELSFINLAGYLEGPLWRGQNLSFAAGIRRSAIDLLLPAVLPDDANLSFTTAPQYYDGQLRVDWRPNERHRVAALGLISFDLLSLLSDNENPNDPMLSGVFENQSGFARGMLTWQYRGEQFQNRAIAALGDNDFRFEVGADRMLRIETTLWSLRDDLEVALARGVRAKAGVDAQLTAGHARAHLPLPPQEGAGDLPNFTTDPLIDRDVDFTDDRLAAYASLELRPLPRLELTPGIRVDHYDRLDQTTVGPRLAASVQLTDRLTARASAGSYSRSFDSAEAARTDLLPERATQYTAGAELRLFEGATASATGFYTRRRDLVVQDSALIGEGGDAIDAYVNRGTGDSIGAELLVRLRRDNLYGWLAYTASRSTRVDGPEMAERLFDWDQTHNFIAVASWRWRHWTFGGRWQYTTGSPFTPIVGSVYMSDVNAYVPRFGAPNSDRLESAHQLDLRVDRTWTFPSWSLSAYLDVTNAYAHAQTVSYQYNFDYSEREAVTSLPTLPAFGIRGAF